MDQIGQNIFAVGGLEQCAAERPPTTVAAGRDTPVSAHLRDVRLPEPPRLILLEDLLPTRKLVRKTTCV
jgi:hypothetical protein